MGKYRIAVDLPKCTAYDGCSLACLNACPTKVLAHRPVNPANPAAGVLIQATHPLLCDGCLDCVNACERGAITVAAT
jgi:ferredoxin